MSKRSEKESGHRESVSKTCLAISRTLRASQIANALRQSGTRKGGEMDHAIMRLRLMRALPACNHSDSRWVRTWSSFAVMPWKHRGKASSALFIVAVHRGSLPRRDLVIASIEVHEMRRRMIRLAREIVSNATGSFGLFVQEMCSSDLEVLAVVQHP